MSAAALSPLPGWDEDRYEGTDAGEPGPCPDCQAAAADLAKARALLRTIRRLEARPAKPDGLEDSPADLAVIGNAVLLATIHARIDLYLARRP